LLGFVGEGIVGNATKLGDWCSEDVGWGDLGRLLFQHQQTKCPIRRNNIPIYCQIFLYVTRIMRPIPSMKVQDFFDWLFEWLKAQNFFDWLENISKLIPSYLNELFYLVSSPKRFIAERLYRDKLTMKNALVFLILSFLIGELLDIYGIWNRPFVVAAQAVFVLLSITLYGTALQLAWRIVGGKAEFHKVLTILFYYSGVLKIAISLFFLAFIGTMMALDPGLSKAMQSALNNGEIFLFVENNLEKISASRGYRFSLLFQFVGYGCMLVWLIAGWGAYRELNQVSKFRSFMAGLLFIVFCTPITALTFVLAFALTALLGTNVNTPNAG
jgi:hypothetical protein